PTRGPIKEGSEHRLKHRRASVGFEMTVRHVALHPISVGIEIRDRLKRARLEVRAPEVNSHPPPRIVERTDVNPVGVLPFAVALAEVPTLELCQNTHETPRPRLTQYCVANHPQSSRSSQPKTPRRTLQESRVPRCVPTTS